MARDKDWQRLEDYLVARFRVIDHRCATCPGSGNKGAKGDLKFSKCVGIHIEAKWRNLLSVFQQNWFEKCKEEVPLHANNIPVLFTEDKCGRKMAHLDADDFIDLFISNYQHENQGEFL